MNEPDSRPLNGELPIESVRRLLAEAERVSRELGEVADDLVARAESGRRDARRVAAALREAAATLAGEELGEEAEDAPAAGSDGARLLARQMLANGAERGDVEQDLRNGFGIENADEIVDSLLNTGK
jgi:hypothetical protein